MDHPRCFDRRHHLNLWDNPTHCSRCGLKRAPRYPNGRSYTEAVYGPFGQDCTCTRDWR